MLRANQSVFHLMPSLGVGSQDDICGCGELWRGSGQGIQGLSMRARKQEGCHHGQQALLVLLFCLEWELLYNSWLSL